MQQLDTLKLAGNGLSQLYPLSGLTGLRTLVLRGNAIKELQPLSHLGELQSLDVHGNRISGLPPHVRAAFPGLARHLPQPD